jgi:hypothetical protein
MLKLQYSVNFRLNKQKIFLWLFFYILFGLTEISDSRGSD